MSTSNRHGFNTVFNSQLPKRERRNLQRRIAIWACCAILALIVVLLVTLLIYNAATKSPSGKPNTPPAETTGAVQGGSIEYTNVTVEVSDTRSGTLVLVNEGHAYTLPNSTAHLKSIYTQMATHSSPRPYSYSGLSEKMDEAALLAMDSMLVAQKAATGTVITVRYAYPDGTDHPATATDELYTGLGVELKMINEDQSTKDLTADPTVYTWFRDNAHKYGFVMRYPAEKATITGNSGDINYFRYVGVAHAAYMYQNNLCLEEYLDVLKQQSSTSTHLTVTGGDNNRYEIYYIPVTDSSTVIPCPTNYSYTLSGTNEGAVVVTVNLSDPVSTAK